MWLYEKFILPDAMKYFAPSFDKGMNYLET